MWFLFSAFFKAKESGGGSVEIHDSKVLLNDGQGTPASLSISSFQLNINDVGRRYINDARSPDIDSPELFTPEISRDPNIFDGKWFLVFATQDKGSGIDHYKVCEKIKTTCVIAESPYVLQNQSLDRKIFVKAIDKNGNERIVMLPPKFAPWYKKPMMGMILTLLALVVLLLVVKWLWKKWKNIIHE